LGRFVAEFGSLGSGPEQFNNPQGLAVHSSGRVIVADSGNRRLQVLSFDGANFGFLRSIVCPAVPGITAGFNGPTGVTTYGQDRIIVADTGNHTIKVLTREGSGFVVAEYSQPNDGYTGPFNAPRGVAVEPDGDIVIADTGNHRVVTVRGVLLGHRRIWLPLAMRR
jgi:DNA-binding beta-propeller fold protein YncE